jgi:hypothetical protein
MVGGNNTRKELEMNVKNINPFNMPIEGNCYLSIFKSHRAMRAWIKKQPFTVECIKLFIMDNGTVRLYWK